MKKRLINNSIFGAGQALINIFLIFFTIPMFIKMLGIESYGVFSLIMVIGSLNSLSNLGLNNALIKFIAEQGKTRESNVDILVTLILVSTLIIPITFFVLYFNEFILISILKVPTPLFLSAKFFFIWVVIANALLLIGQILKAVLDGLQKIYLTSIQQAVYNILYWGLILITLVLGYNLPEIGFSIFITAIIWLLITIVSVFKVWGKISFEGFIIGYKMSAKKQLKYGLQIYSGGLISFFYEPLSKVLISNYIGVSAVGFYDIALKLKGQIWGIILKIFYPLFPFLSEQQDMKVVGKYVHDLEQKMFFIVTPLIAIVILVMHSLISIWIGNNVEIIAITSIFIISFHLAGSSTVIPNYQFLLAKNLAGKTIILQLSNVIFNAVFFLATVSFIGYYALIFGNIAGILSSFILSIYYQKIYLNSLIFDSYSQVIRLIMTFLILILVGYSVTNLLNGNDIIILILVPILVIMLSLSCYKYFRLINQMDIVRYFGKSNKISKALLIIFNK